MAKLAKKELKFLKKKEMKNNRGFEQNNVAGQARSREDLSVVQTNAGMTASATRSNTFRNVNAETYENGSGSHWPLEQDERVEAFFSNEAENPQQEIPNPSGLDGAEQNNEWSANDTYFTFGANTIYDLSSFGMRNVFRDLSGWDVPPNLTDRGSSASTEYLGYPGHM